MLPEPGVADHRTLSARALHYVERSAEACGVERGRVPKVGGVPRWAGTNDPASRSVADAASSAGRSRIHQFADGKVVAERLYARWFFGWDDKGRTSWRRWPHDWPKNNGAS